MPDIRKLRPFQEKVFDYIVKGRNVLLQAPTGSGKTHAAIYPYLYYLAEQSSSLPRHMIYATPMRILANQFVEEYQPHVQKYDVEYKLRLPRPAGGFVVEILTGENRRDCRFDAALTFATIDQVLSSYLMTPYSLSRRLGNFNAGAVASSYLVFDEFHLFDPASTLPTTLQMLKELNGIVPFILMTATFPTSLLRMLADELDAEIYPHPERSEELDSLLALDSQDKKRYIQPADEPLTGEAVRRLHREHGNKRTLVTCNTVDRARQLFDDIDHPHKVLLHSRFLPADRARKEDGIREIFGKRADADADVIVVATQVVEVGLDMTCELLLTELAPANSLVQRAGRCARYKGNEGQVIVFRHAMKDGEAVDLLDNPLPYGGQKAEFQKTWDWLLSRNSNQHMGFDEEQGWLEYTHQEQTQRLIADLQASESDHRKEMYSVMGTGDYSRVSNLIRNVQSYNITIHPDPDDLLDNPFAAPLLSVNAYVVHGAMRTLLEIASSIEAEGDLISALFEVADAELDEENKTTYRKECVNTVNDLAGARMLVIHPDLATYSPELGLQLGIGGVWPEAFADPQMQDKSSGSCARPDITYKMETYEEHIAHVWAAFEGQVWPRFRTAARNMELKFGWPQGVIRRMAELAVLLHDVGKLSTKWQKRAHTWQSLPGKTLVSADTMLAHTDYDPDTEWGLAKQVGRQPPHAAEGAFAVIDVIFDDIEKWTDNSDPLGTAVISTILRHHTPFYTSQVADFQLEAYAVDAIKSTLHVSISMQNLRPTLGDEPEDIAEYIVHPHEAEGFLVYQLLARVLRESDQIGTARGTEATHGL